jgi:hypothetical protein
VPVKRPYKPPTLTPLVRRGSFPEELLSLWSAACERYEGQTGAPRDFAAWSGATKDLLLGFGLFFNGETFAYELEGRDR